MEYKDKLTKINSLTPEVSVFHPFLQELFTRMPTFSKVIYNQGTQEFGADFILESTGKFKKVEYSGVIVKCGKITQSSLQEVDRQVSECFLMERLIEGGLTQVRITDAIIITNEKISGNAKQLINRNHKDKSITFLEADDLISLVDEYYESYWDNENIFLGKFLETQKSKAKNLCINNILHFDSEVNYVEVKIRAKKLMNNNPKLINFRNIEKLSDALHLSNLILIEGNMGSGKSVYIAKFVLDLVADIQKTKTIDFLPIIIEFAELKNNIIEDIEFIIDNYLNELNGQVESPKFYIFLDGFDEVNFSNEERKDFITDFAQMTKTRHNCKFVLTTRTIEDYEFELFLDQYFSQFILSALQHKQVMKIIDSFCQTNSSQNKQIAQSSLFNMLPRTPITAILLGQILKTDPKEIPSTLTELYSKFTEIVLSRWDSSDLKSQTEYEVLVQVCGSLAKFLLDNSLNVVSVSDFRQIVNSYLTDRNLQIDENDILEKVLNNKEIFNVSFEKNTIKFRHRSFCEFFFANNLLKNKVIEINEEIYNPYWQNSYFFYFGLKKDSEELIDDLKNIAFTDEGLSIHQVMVNSEFMLASYLTPYKKICEILETNLSVASNAVFSIINDVEKLKKIEKVGLSRFELIIIVMLVVSKAYSYEFFDKAMISIGDNILSISKNRSEQDWFKLFLIATTLLERGNQEYLEILIQEYLENADKMSFVFVDLLFQIIINNKLNNTPNLTKFLKIYQKKLNKGSKHSKLINGLIKSK